MTPHNNGKDAIIEHLESNLAHGLSEAQVSERKEKFGENKLREKKKKTTLQRFLDQFKDVMIIILLIAAAISFVIVCVEKNWGELFEPALILLIVILNAVMGVMQESKAEKALDALKNMSAPHARVIRNGIEKIIDAAELVPGDIIKLEAGDFVPADARLLHSASLKSEESALTGESVPSEKDAEVMVDENAPIGDRTNMVFSGCSITYGNATAIVTATGMDTEMGKIANLLDGESDGQTPLQQKLAQLGKEISALKEQESTMRAKWQQEKELADSIQSAKHEIEELKFEAERAEREGNYGRVAEIRYGKITRLDAACDLHIFELSSRIGELERKGYVFDKESKTGRNKYNRRTRYTVYRLADNGGKV